MNEPKTEKTDGQKTAKETEAEFLTRQGETSRAAIANALSEAKTALGEGLDPKEWTRRYPFLAIGSALAAGFVAAVLTIPSKEQQELRRLAKIHQALHPEPEPPKPVEKEESSNHKPEKGKSIWMTLLLESVALIRPILISAITSMFTPRAPDPNEDGQGPESNKTPKNP